MGGWGGWLETDNRAISVQLNLTGTATGTELSNIFRFVYRLHYIQIVQLGHAVSNPKLFLKNFASQNLLLFEPLTGLQCKIFKTYFDVETVSLSRMNE